MLLLLLFIQKKLTLEQEGILSLNKVFWEQFRQEGEKDGKVEHISVFELL